MGMPKQPGNDPETLVGLFRMIGGQSSCVHSWSLDELGVRGDLDWLVADAREALENGAYRGTDEVTLAHVQRNYIGDELNLKRTRVHTLMSPLELKLHGLPDDYVQKTEGTEPVTKRSERLVALRAFQGDHFESLRLEISRHRRVVFDEAGSQLTSLDDKLELRLHRESDRRYAPLVHSDVRMQTSMVTPGQTGTLNGWADAKVGDFYPPGVTDLPPAINKENVAGSILAWHCILEMSNPVTDASELDYLNQRLIIEVAPPLTLAETL